MYKSLGILIFSIALSSCDQISGENEFQEGLIEYEITYPKPPEDKYLERILPSSMSLKFKKEMTKSEVSMSMGMIKMFYLTNSKDRKLTELVKFMTNKYNNELSDSEIQEMIAEIPNHKIEFSDDQKIIANYNCKKAIVYVEDEEPYSFDLYYTEDINIPSNNWCTPFSEIPGVLMEYELKRYNILMHFKASNIEPAKFELKEFTPDTDYKIVDRAEMKKMHMMFEQLNE